MVEPLIRGLLDTWSAFQTTKRVPNHNEARPQLTAGYVQLAVAWGAARLGSVGVARAMAAAAERSIEEYTAAPALVPTTPKRGRASSFGPLPKGTTRSPQARAPAAERVDVVHEMVRALHLTRIAQAGQLARAKSPGVILDHDC